MLFFASAFGLTSLSPGDIVILTVNSDAGYNPSTPNSNGFDFVTRVNLDAGTELFFTDIAWTGTSWRTGGE